MKKNYTIKDLLVLLLGKVWYIVAASIVCAILALFVSKFVMSKQYQSHVSMYVKSADNQSTLTYRTLTLQSHWYRLILLYLLMTR